MSEHKVNLSWSREGLEFTYKNFSRNHEWDFGNGNVIRATAAPEFLGSPELVDPEQAFVAYSELSCTDISGNLCASENRSRFVH